MPNPKLKSENYQNFGGINSKFSPFVLSNIEFLNIINFDFQTPGSLTQRWGSTQYTSQTFPGPVNSLFEFQRLDGSSYVFASYSGGIFYGATTGNYQGVSFSTSGTTYNNFAYFYFLDYMGFGTTGIKSSPVAPFYQGDLGQILTASGYYESAPALTQTDNTLSYAVLDNYLFAADGNKFFKFDGATTTYVGTPFPQTYLNPMNGVPTALFATVNTAAASSVTFGVGLPVGPSYVGSYNFYASYVNNRGFESQIFPVLFVDATQYSAATLGGSFISVQMQMNVPTSYGISSINVYSYFQSASLPFPSGLYLNNVLQGITTWYPAIYSFLGNYSAGVSGFATVPLGTTTGNFGNLVTNNGSEPDPIINTYYPLGYTLTNSTTYTSAPYYDSILTTAFAPRYLEVYKNQLFLAGFSSMPSTVYFSDIGEPEGYPLENSFEVRTNDADYITCIKAYFTRFYIFKKNSFHALYGDNVNNFYIQEISTLYGCLNNRAAVTYDNLLAFLDRKGVMLYNGASVECLSNKVQPYFDRMNYNVALNTAIMVHDKLRNQLLIGIPIDGSSKNNITIVFDYLVNAWTTYNGFNPSIFATIQGYNNTKNAFYGSYSGTINWFGASFLNDNGIAPTLYYKTRFLHDMGDSVEKQFRRLYINADSVGLTLGMPVNFYQDYGSSIVKSVTFSLGAFQNRIDFGIPAKSLAYELININNSNSPLRIHGFTIESRLQRRV